ncbi:MAG: VCBS repeat-containing protein, partial [Thermoguttaceae bacterium]|nr:VCBS repeat-containing protein [Thermoguttaceae bacterium]
WNPSLELVDVMAADFTGDGKADIAGRIASTGDWWMAESTGTGFTNAKWTRWNPNLEWVNVMAADFTGDGKADVVGRIATTGDWWVAESNGDSFTNTKWTRWNRNLEWGPVLVGNFAGAALHAESAPPAGQPAPESITTADLQPIVEEAALRLSADLAGLSFQVQVADLPGLKLGLASGNTILIDHNAAGFGWYVDTTDADFQPGDRPGELVALSGSDAADRIDLLSVVMHELYHLAGRGHDENGLMQPALGPGIRRLPLDELVQVGAASAQPAWSAQQYGTLAWLDELATARREEPSAQSLQVQAIDEVLKFYWQ